MANEVPLPKTIEQLSDCSVTEECNTTSVLGGFHLLGLGGREGGKLMCLPKV